MQGGFVTQILTIVSKTPRNVSKQYLLSLEHTHP
jgi:hypothetical protein